MRLKFCLVGMKRFFFLRRFSLNAIIPLDPGHMQLHGAIRALCIVMLTGIIGIAATQYFAWPLTSAALPILFAMASGALFRDAFSRDKWTTFFCGMAGAFLCYPLAAWVTHQSATFGHLSFVLMGVLCILLHTQGARFVSVGLSSFIMYYLGLLIAPSAAQVYQAWLLLVMAGFSFCLFSFWVMPNRPVQNLLRMMKALCRSAHEVIRAVDTIPQQGLTIQKKARINYLLNQFNALILSAETQLSLTEISVSTQIRQSLRDLEVAVQRYSRYVQQSAVQNDNHARILNEVIHIVHYFEECIRQPDVLLTQESKKEGSSQSTVRMPLAWKHGLRTLVAGLIGLLIGFDISDQRWYWAMFAVLVIYMGARTTEEVSVRAIERMLGTVLGILCVAVTAHFVQGNTVAEIVVMLISVFGWTYFIATNYVLGVMFATSQSLFAYEKLGFDLHSLLPLRFEENLIGCLAAVLVSYVIFSAKTRTFETEKSKEILAQLSDTLTACCQQIQQQSDNTIITASHQFDMLINAWVKANRPHHLQRLFLWWMDSGINPQSWSAIAHQMHMLIQRMSHTNVAAIQTSDKEQWMQEYATLHQNIRALQAQLAQNNALTHADLISLAVKLAALNDISMAFPHR